MTNWTIRHRVAVGLCVTCLVAVAVWIVVTHHGARAAAVPVDIEPPTNPRLPGTTQSATSRAKETLDAAEAENCPIRFSMVSDNGGVTFRHQTGTSPEKPFPAANGSGIAVLDFDQDGDQDLYLATGTPFPINLTGKSPHNQIYRNQGDWRFQDVTEPTGLGHNGYTAGLAVGDFDNDGFPDVFLSCFGPDVLYRNCGDGTFQKTTAGVEDPRWGTSATFLDYDQDGQLDLYVCNYGDWTLATNKYCGNREKNVRIYCSPHTLDPVRDSLFHNLGNGQFADVSDASGIDVRIGRSQGVIAADFNQDGRTDIYVGNDLHANSLFMNAGGGKFADVTEASGAGYNERGQMQAGMGVDVGDVNGDGQFDLFVTNFAEEANTLYEQIGDWVYRDASVSLNLAADGIPWVGWGCALRDLDLDGAEDVWVVNGHVDDNLHLMGKDSPFEQPSIIWHQEQGRFRALNGAVGDYFQARHPARALVLADLDNDGDLDAVVGHQDAIPTLLRNDRLARGAQEPSASVVLELIGTVSNRSAIGAVVTLEIDGQSRLQPVRGGGGYLSASDLRLIFAVPAGGTTISAKVLWPSGGVHQITIPQGTAVHRIVEPQLSAESPAQPESP